MSTILDALKKSEQERKLNQVPKLSDMPMPQESPRWPLVVIAMLSLVLALVLGVLISQWVYNSQQRSEGPNLDAHSRATQTPAHLAEAEAEFDVVVNVVSYSDQPKQRFVVLDGEMYRENDFVKTGLKVHEIKTDSVVLNWRGELVTRTP